MRILATLALIFLACVASPAQNAQSDKTSHTIDVTAAASVEATADVAIVTVSCETYGTTSEAAYEENARVGNGLLAALEKAGVSKSAIQTSGVEVVEPRYTADWTPKEKIERRYRAKHSLSVKTLAKDASSLVDLAMHSGASTLDSVKWELADAAAVDAKATATALANAKTIANQLAQGMGRKVGAIISVSNSYESREFDRLEQYASLQKAPAMIRASEPIILIPEKIKESANVHAVFEME